MRVLPPAKSYAIALAALVAAVLLRWALDPLVGDFFPLVTLFGAVTIAVWAGGYKPAAILAVVGYFACDFLFIAPRGELGPRSVATVVGLGAYLFTCALIIGIGETMRAAQSRANERGELLRVTLGSIGDAVITADSGGRIDYMNAIAESLTGWSLSEALNQPLDAVFRIVDEKTRETPENPATRVLRDGAVVALSNHTILIAKDGNEHPIDDSAAPIKDGQGQISGCVLIFRDVGAKRTWDRSETDRLLAARLLASIVETSDDAIISKSLDGIIQSWNAAAERLFGYTAKEAVGRHISLVIPPERIAEEDQIIACLKAGQRIDHFETERMRSDGQRVLVSLTVSPIKNADGKVVGASKIVRDVTQQRHSEERERRLLAEAASANAKFRAFFDQGALFAGIMDVDGTLIDANRLSWEGCGYTRDQVIGKPFWEGPWWAPSATSAAQIKAGSAEAAAGRMFRAELPYFVADGTERVVDVIILPIKDDAGRVLFLAPTGTDITDRKRAEADRQRFATLVENSTDFIGICDVEGVPFYINAAGLKLVGLDGIDEARRVHVGDFFFPEDRSKVMNEFFPTVVEKGHGEIEIRFRNFRTGAPRWMAYKVVKLTDAAGKPVAFATVSQDVTERRRMEDDLRKLAADLSEVDRRKDEFLAMLAHELRNPLAPMRSMVEVLKRGGGDAFPQALDTLERQLGHVVRLVDDLLDINRISHNRIELRKGRIELAPVIRQAVEASRPMVDGAGQTLQVIVPPEPIYLDADSARLVQIFGNLLNNSCKYTGPGGKITVTVARQANEATVSILDTGTGIPADQLDSIFEMFTQIDRTLERTQGGLGIGLALVKRLVEMHGGSIVAKSAGEDQGSEFVVRLPLDVDLPRKDPTHAPGVQPAARTRRVLVVDDNRDAAASLALVLEIAGHETFAAYDGAEALRAVEEHQPDIVLLDIGMPKMNGYEVCRRIRQQPGGKDKVVIALTGWGQDEDRRKSREAGFDAHLVKPVEIAELTKLLGTRAPVT